ncbi:recombinase family protein [Neobacillus sp. 3P2-tot-E-2]|uniref:recombinase family protein n=1 Tax=Neobacillus sp. 3P2-tot-E-2 TaxID=3132212 RepID=UPI0039A2A634
MRCAVYVRVSTDRDEQKQSLENQKQLFYNFIAEKQWELHEVYVDVESGTTDKRISFQQMIDDGEKGKFDCILAKELSRIARNGELAYKIKRVLHSNKIHFITLDGAINTLEDNTDKFGLYAWLYEEESQRMSSRIKTALEQRALKGEFKGSHPPYGYFLKNKKLYPRNDETVVAVEKIFSLYVQGVGLEAIAKKMDEAGYPTPAQVAGKKNAGQFWHGSTIKTILKNPHYTGDLAQGRTKVRSVVDKVRDEVAQEDWIVIKNTHEPIIPREEFEAVQNIMKSRYMKRPKAKIHLFTNVIYCADCGTGLWFLKNRNGYVCGRYRKHGVRACTSHSVKENYIKETVLDDLRKIISASVDEEGLLKKVKPKIKKQEQMLSKEIEKKENKISELKKENKKFLKLLANEVIEKLDYDEAVNENRSEIKKLQSDILQKKEMLKQYTKSTEMLQKVQKELKKVIDINDITPELLHKLMHKIEVKENKDIIIHYRFSNPFFVK